MGFWKLKQADLRTRLRGEESGRVGGYRDQPAGGEMEGEAVSKMPHKDASRSCLGFLNFWMRLFGFR